MTILSLGGISKKVNEALKLLYNTHLNTFFEQMESHRWRRTKLWNQECDLVYKSLFRGVQKLYEKFSGKYSLPGAKEFMSLDEFVNLVTDSGVVDDNFGSREIGTLFNLAMMT
jgi:hypothetical protein